MSCLFCLVYESPSQHADNCRGDEPIEWLQEVRLMLERHVKRVRVDLVVTVEEP